MKGSQSINVLTVSAAKSLTGEPVAEVAEKDWQKANAATKARFNNVGFDIDLDDFTHALQGIRKTVRSQPWDGILVGWCMRGYPERTEQFEQIMALLFEELREVPKTKVMFSTGPENLYETTVRNFPQ